MAIAQIRAEVASAVAAAKAEGAKFVIQGDSWKPRMKRGASLRL